MYGLYKVTRAPLGLEINFGNVLSQDADAQKRYAAEEINGNAR
jgi:hypothetical protein